MRLDERDSLGDGVRDALDNALRKLGEARADPKRLCIPKTQFSLNHGHLSTRIRSRGVARRGGGMGTRVSVGTVE